MSFGKVLKSQWYHAKVLPKGHHLNGHTIEFRHQSQKFELHYVLLIDARSEMVKFQFKAGLSQKHHIP